MLLGDADIEVAVREFGGEADQARAFAHRRGDADQARIGGRHVAQPVAEHLGVGRLCRRTRPGCDDAVSPGIESADAVVEDGSASASL